VRGLDAHRAAVFEVLLDARVLIEDIDDHAAVVAAVDGGAENPFRVFAYPACEVDFDVVRSAEVEVVGDQGFEESAGVPGCVEDEGLRDISICRIATNPAAYCNPGTYTPEIHPVDALDLEHQMICEDISDSAG
jgi:hypothetical protein